MILYLFEIYLRIRVFKMYKMINYFLLSDLFLFFSVGFVYDTFVLRQSFKKHINDEKILYILCAALFTNV